MIVFCRSSTKGAEARISTPAATSSGDDLKLRCWCWWEKALAPAHLLSAWRNWLSRAIAHKCRCRGSPGSCLARS